MLDKGTCPICSVPIEVNNPDNLPDYTCDCLKCHALLIRMDGRFQHYATWASNQRYSKWKVQKKGRKKEKIPPRSYKKRDREIVHELSMQEIIERISERYI